MSTVVTLGAFLDTPSLGRLTTAQRAVASLAPGLSLNGSLTRFVGHGEEAPVTITVTLPRGSSASDLTREAVQAGYLALDNLLTDGERLTDYALVSQDGVQTHVVTLLDGTVRALHLDEAAVAPAAPAAPARSRRWNPFARS